MRITTSHPAITVSYAQKMFLRRSKNVWDPFMSRIARKTGG
jgi:hypothetical protein